VLIFRICKNTGIAICLFGLLAPICVVAWAQKLPRDVQTAVNVANILIAARVVISDQQPHINDAAIGDKKINAKAIVDLTKIQFKKMTGKDLNRLIRDRRVGLLYQAEIAAIGFAVSDAEYYIDQAGVGFKGFVPAIFARAVMRHFNGMAGSTMQLRFTAPAHLIRNRFSRPDDWEKNALNKRLMDAKWPKGKPFYTSTVGSDGRRLRVLVPEYFQTSCLACHGSPKKELDVSGHAKEGARLNSLAGVISVSSVR
jgi:hypothetical protein